MRRIWRWLNARLNIVSHDPWYGIVDEYLDRLEAQAKAQDAQSVADAAAARERVADFRARLAAANLTPMSDEDIDAEIEAHRDRRARA